MKTPLLLIGCAACLLLPATAKDKKETPLGKDMESLSDAFKAMRKEHDPAKSAALARDAQQALAKAMTETPAVFQKMPDGPAKDKAAAEYRKSIGKVFVSFCELEEAFLSGDSAEAEKIMAAIKDMKKAGHEKFTEDD